MSYRKKLIEVALPLDAINRAATTEKSIRHGHPSTLHLWWARRPLATCRAVLFASLIDDPSEHDDLFKTVEEQDNERERLFRLIERFVDWKNIHDEKLLAQVKAEIEKATNGNPPPVLDLFAGGGSIPLEAQRLGLEAYASDLNPVAVLINKALIEIPPKFANQPPVSLQKSQLFQDQKKDWKGAHGLAADIRYYGKWIRDEAEKRIGYLYPKAKLSDGSKATVIAWIWARTVTCPNPACAAKMPLVRSFALSTKKSKETWAEPTVDQTSTPPTISFTIKTGKGKPQDGTVNRQGAKCIACGTTVLFDYIRKESKAGRMGTQFMAVVAEGIKERIYISPDKQNTHPIGEVKPNWIPDAALSYYPGHLNTVAYGLDTFDKLFTPRQLVALTTFSDLVREAHQLVLSDAVAAGLPDDGQSLHVGGCGALAYADAVTTYLGMGVSRLSDICNALCRWENTKSQVRNLFARQAIPMIWDFAEPNVFAGAAGDFGVSMGNLVKALETTPAKGRSFVKQRDATASMNGIAQPMISTDPPYYDNIGYADLSDFFYVWLRHSLADIHPDLFRTMLVPKKQELVATPYRFEGSKSKAQEFFETGLGQAFERMRAVQHPDYPLTVYYAFKQAETERSGVKSGDRKGDTVIASTGWETMLEGLIQAGFTIMGTWPMRTELMNRSLGKAQMPLPPLSCLFAALVL